MIRIFEKDKKMNLCYGLTLDEFKCKCDKKECRSTIISEDLIGKYEKFRKLISCPLKINSGYRCNAHNFDVGGVSTSRHQTGEAIDISLATLGHLTENDIEHLIQICGFSFHRFYKTFFHMDCRQK